MADGLASLADMLPPGMAGLLEQARTALDQSGTPAPEVVELAERLRAVESRLDVIAFNLEMALEMFARLPAAWNVLAGNLDALTAVAGKPLAKLGLALAPTPKV